MTRRLCNSQLAFAFASLLALGACSAVPTLAGGKVEGTYENAQANASIEFMPGGKAHFSLYGAGGDCTYKVEGNKVTVTIEKEPVVFTINDDGSLSGPAEGYFSRLKKKK